MSWIGAPVATADAFDDRPRPGFVSVRPRTINPAPRVPRAKPDSRRDPAIRSATTPAVAPMSSRIVSDHVSRHGSVRSAVRVLPTRGAG